MKQGLMVRTAMHAALAAMVALAPLPAHAAGSTLHGSRIVEALQDNTASGMRRSGTPYNLYFLQGGQVTYTDADGRRDTGSWSIGEAGGICLRWAHAATPGAGCYRVTVDGRNMTWTNAERSLRFVLQGTVTSAFP